MSRHREVLLDGVELQLLLRLDYYLRVLEQKLVLDVFQLLHLEEDILQLLSQCALLQRGACRLVERASQLRVAQFVGLASLVCDEAQVLGFYREGLQLSLENSNLIFEPVDLVLSLLLQRLVLLAVVVLVLLALLVELFIFGPLVRQLLLQLALLQF